MTSPPELAGIEKEEECNECPMLFREEVTPVLEVTNSKHSVCLKPVSPVSDVKTFDVSLKFASIVENRNDKLHTGA